MAETKRDQRATRRFSLRLPVEVKVEDGQAADQPAFTKDVSARGIFFFIDSPVEPGSKIDFILTLPPEVTLTENIRVRCRGQIVRVEQQSAASGGRLGVAAAIESYDFVGVS
jgi:hypothetical protein